MLLPLNMELLMAMSIPFYSFLLSLPWQYPVLSYPLFLMPTLKEIIPTQDIKSNKH